MRIRLSAIRVPLVRWLVAGLVTGLVNTPFLQGEAGGVPEHAVASKNRVLKT